MSNYLKRFLEQDTTVHIKISRSSHYQKIA
uniref:Uncharacterized protein n=1 Tax=Rhizophora mucronata TaxID=61149 RepID=A0A2P2J3Q5_RHIMU